MAAARASSEFERDIATRLGVRLLLAGSIVQSDNRIRINVMLNDPQSGRTIAATEIERTPATVLSARSEIVKWVAVRLGVTPPPRAGVRRRPCARPRQKSALLLTFDKRRQKLLSNVDNTRCSRRSRPDAVRPARLAAELAALLKDPTVVVVAVGNSADDFTAGHVPGARFVLYDDIALAIDGLQSELPPIEALRRVLANAGISDRSKVIIYGSTIAATRLFFTLDYFGHPNARVLNGGLSAWKAHGGAIETGPPTASTATGADAEAAAATRVSARTGSRSGSRRRR